MTGRTHDLAAFTALSAALVITPPTRISLMTLIVCLGVNFIGGLYPDLDNASADVWKKMRGGKTLGKIVSPLLGGHRMITHSLVGMAITGWVLWALLGFVQTVILVDMNLVWWAFMIGYWSHLFMDSMTREGVPLLFPLPWKIGVPPIKRLRIRTGGNFEKMVVYPGLLLMTGHIYWQNYGLVVEFLKTRVE